MAEALRLSYPEPTIALLEFDLPGKSVNVLSQSMLGELATHLDALEQRGDLDGLVIASAKPTGFLAGADVREFAASLATGTSDVATLCHAGQALFRRLSQVPFVTVAAIHGVCLGGGAELASWCDRRVLSRDPATEFGCPEVKLGLIPGWGGTVRLPRLIGLANAVELITGGESIGATRAEQLGLAWDTPAPERLITSAIAAIRAGRQHDQYLKDREAAQRSTSMSPTEITFLGATASAMIQRETYGNYPAPLLALEVMLEGASASVDEALQREAAAFGQVFGSPVNRALVNVFFLTDRAKKPLLELPHESAGNVQHVGVVGAGIMGAGIAAANIKREVATTLVDVSAAALEKGVREVMQDIAYNKQTQRPDAARAMHLGAKLHSSTTVTALAECDLVVEAIVETPAAKQQLYAQLEQVLRADAVLASNTSTIPITQLAKTLQRPERFCGIHFFNPVRRMKLVEIIRGEQTSEVTLATAAAFARRIGKFAIVVKDSPGFVVNRLLSPYLNSALALIHDGVSIRDIDRAALKFGMPIGPIALYDLVGLDTAFYAGRTMYEAFPERFIASPLLPALMKSGRLGQKNGLGFYNYQNKRAKAENDPKIEKLLETYIKEKVDIGPEQITWRLFLPMLLEATRVLEEGIVADARDIDLGLIYGLGFPPFKGGLLYWADQLGAVRLLEVVQEMAASGKQFVPSALLTEMARNQQKFYASRAA
jgi:3-hydroxyacyl-CoA dehydrogenase/enoyl-CoA hydratase/carnithine racemase